MTATFFVGDAIEVMGKLPEKSVDLILTSPPFLALRSYLPADHPDKVLEGGSQATPGAFIDWLVDVVEACDRVLAPHGSLCIELGDTYSGSPASGQRDDEWYPTYADAYPRREYVKSGTGWPLAKSLSLIPELFRLTLVYGTNPLTGRQTDRWRLRNVVRWVRPNPPVGALGDKFRPATSELMVFCKSAKRYFDLDAVREPFAEATLQRNQPNSAPQSIGGAKDNTIAPALIEARMTHAGAPPLDWWKVPDSVVERVLWCEQHKQPYIDFGICNLIELDGYPCRFVERLLIPMPLSQDSGTPLDWWNIPLLEGEEETRYGPKPEKPYDRPNLRGQGSGPKGHAHTATPNMSDHTTNPLGAPPLDWWNIPPGGYEGAHYAVFPPELCIKPIKSMCPEKVCKVCGDPSRRIVGETEYHSTNGGRVVLNMQEGERLAEGVNQWKGPQGRPGHYVASAPTLGFSDCGHDDWRPGLVLDPFGGSGTTALVATGHGRDCILIDLDERNYELALQRVGPFILERGEL